MRGYPSIGGAGAALPLLLFVLAGCGDDHPAPPPAPRQVAQAPAPAGPPLTGQPDAAPPDPSVPADPLANGQDALTGGQAQPANVPDPLESGHDALGGGASGPAMPTQHSHWLKGGIFNARVTVRVNGLFLGEYAAPVDRDISMRLHSGVNTVTFAYRPLSPTASARLDVLESEHDPPIPPLASFRSALPDAGASHAASTPQTETQTFTFLAR